MSLKGNVFNILQTTDSIEFTFSSTMKNIDDVCERTTHYIQSKIQGIDLYLFPINLVIREGLTNAVRHGNKGDPDKIVRFLLTIFDNKAIKLMIEDQGDGFNWRKLKKSDPSENKDHGRGIMIIESYFSHYSYNDKGNILYLEKEIFSKI